MRFVHVQGVEASSEAALEVGLRQFDGIYTFLYSRVANRADAEDLTQQVALKALPRLRDGWAEPAVRGYLYTTARSVLASFWACRARIPERELTGDVWDEGRGRE